MVLAKTDKGRASLSERRALSPRERQLLVLADGKRAKAELAGLLGFEIDEMVSRLVMDGYLTRVGSVRQRATDFADSGPIKFRPTRPRIKPKPKAGQSLDSGFSVSSGFEPSQSAAGVPATPRTRRSLAASKMYMIGLMQMLRDPEAAMLAVSLHGAQDAGELRHWLVGSLVFIHGRSGAEYSTRVAMRLLEVFPRDELAALCDAMVLTQLPAIGALALAHRPAAPQGLTASA